MPPRSVGSVATETIEQSIERMAEAPRNKALQELARKLHLAVQPGAKQTHRAKPGKESEPAMSSQQTSSRSHQPLAARRFSLNDEPPLGGELITRRCGYEHHGIYAGNGTVIHYAGFAKSLHRGPVEEVSIAQFADGYDLIVRQHAGAIFTGMEAVRRARSRLGEDRYRLLTNNCEHFVSWCLFGEARSTQVRACVAHPRVAIQAVKGLLRAYIAAQRSRRANALSACSANDAALVI
jgi:hypothetical protein